MWNTWDRNSNLPTDEVKKVEKAAEQKNRIDIMLYKLIFLFKKVALIPVKSKLDYKSIIKNTLGTIAVAALSVM